MNAIENNAFTRALAELCKLAPRPRAVLCISAHWMTEGTWVTHMAHPRTIHDFYGFPQALFDVRYPAPGSPQVADLVRATVSDPKVQADDEMWGLDHGTWSVLKHIYPEAYIPVVQLSINIAQPAAYHLRLGEQLRPLREQDILIIGSGNIVHNLRKIRWEPQAPAFDWAVEFDGWVKDKLVRRDFEALAGSYLDSEAGRLSVPTPDHYFPMLYVLGASFPDESLRFHFEGIQNGSISMRTFSFGS